MGKIIEIQYNGELGYRNPISDVREFFQIVSSDEEFLKMKKEDSDFNNQDLIFDAYNYTTKIELGFADEDGNLIKNSKSVRADMPCPTPIILYVDADYVSADILVSQSNVLVDNFSVDVFRDNPNKSSFVVSTNQFYERVLKDYLYDDNQAIGIKEGMAEGQREIVKPTVWLWSKSLNENGKFNEGSLFNLSPFVESVDVSQTGSGGQFDIKLLAIDGVFDLNDDGEPIGVWKQDEKRYVKFNNNGVDNFLFRSLLDKIGIRKTEDLNNQTYGQRNQNVNTNNLSSRDRKFKAGEINYNRTETLFKNIISENDIIFISFSNYSSLGVKYTNDFFITNDFLPMKDWQLIGLVDSNQLSVSYENTDLSLSVSGRDCMKLLIEDGSYFFAKSFANPENSDSAFGNVDLPNRGDDNNASNIVLQDKEASGINRLVTTGLIDILYNPEARNVNFVLNLLMSRLSNIEICHSELFKYYGDRRTKFSIPTFETSEVESDIEKENELLD